MDRNICLQSMQVFVVEYSHPLPKPKELVSFGGLYSYMHKGSRPASVPVNQQSNRRERKMPKLPTLT